MQRLNIEIRRGKNKKNLGWEPEFSNIEMFVESYKWFLDEQKQNYKKGMSKYQHQSMVNEGILALLKKLL